MDEDRIPPKDNSVFTLPKNILFLIDSFTA